MLLTLCFVELLGDGSHLLNEYDGIHEVDDWHYGSSSADGGRVRSGT